MAQPSFIDSVAPVCILAGGTDYAHLTKGQLNSEWIYEGIISPKIVTKNYRDFCTGSLLEGRAKISVTMTS